jgi:hypothetical protein
MVARHLADMEATVDPDPEILAADSESNFVLGLSACRLDLCPRPGRRFDWRLVSTLPEHAAG